MNGKHLIFTGGFGIRKPTKDAPIRWSWQDVMREIGFVNTCPQCGMDLPDYCGKGARCPNCGYYKD